MDEQQYKTFTQRILGWLRPSDYNPNMDYNWTINKNWPRSVSLGLTIGAEKTLSNKAKDLLNLIARNPVKCSDSDQVQADKALITEFADEYRIAMSALLIGKNVDESATKAAKLFLNGSLTYLIDFGYITEADARSCDVHKSVL